MSLIIYIMVKFIHTEDHFPEECILKYLKYANKEAFGQEKSDLFVFHKNIS